MKREAANLPRYRASTFEAWREGRPGPLGDQSRFAEAPPRNRRRLVWPVAKDV